MKFLLLNQTFYPDVASTAQHLSDLALGLVRRGHQVTVLTSRRAYDDPIRTFARKETWNGVRILRVGSTGLGKGSRWRRAVDFASFMCSCALRLAFTERPDIVVPLTSPPLISILGASFARVRRCRLACWVMDLNPDEAVAAGWLRAGSLTTRLLEAMSRWSLRRADKVIALDRFMCERLLAKGAHKVRVIPPWSHDSEVRFDAAGRERFRRVHGLIGKFVVMYSGNHSPCHPLETLLEAARRLEHVPDVVFCFVGGGSEWRKIYQQQTRKPTEGHGPKHAALSNIICLPYQPLKELSASLSAADLHVVVMGEPFVGLVHPCKVYNILRIGALLLYVGPKPSHITDLEEATDGASRWFHAKHGDTEKVLEAIERARKEGEQCERRPCPKSHSSFSKAVVLPQVIEELETSLNH